MRPTLNTLEKVLITHAKYNKPMSLRALRHKVFNRAKELEDVNAFWQSLFHEDINNCDWWDDDDYWYRWDDHMGSGSVSSMEQYHQMHLLTLLRSLAIRTARDEANDSGW